MRRSPAVDRLVNEARAKQLTAVFEDELAVGWLLDETIIRYSLDGYWAGMKAQGYPNSFRRADGLKTRAVHNDDRLKLLELIESGELMLEWVEATLVRYDLPKRTTQRFTTEAEFEAWCSRMVLFRHDFELRIHFNVRPRPA